MSMASIGSGGGSWDDGIFLAEEGGSGWGDSEGYGGWGDSTTGEDYSGWGDTIVAEGYGSLRRDGQEFGYGCGSASTDILVPDRPLGINLLPACVAHDLCYDAGTVTPRTTCDALFGEQIRAACIDAGYPALPCGLLGAAYERGVRTFGTGAYDAPAPPPVEYVSHPLDTFLYY